MRIYLFILLCCSAREIFEVVECEMNKEISEYKSEPCPSRDLPEREASVLC